MRDESVEQSAKSLTGLRSSDLKAALTEATIKIVQPIRERFVRTDWNEVEAVIDLGSDKAAFDADQTLVYVKREMGFIR